MPSRPPRKKPGEAAAITGPAIVKAPTKLERIRRREAADAYAMRTRVASRSAGCRRCRNACCALLYRRPKESFAAARAIVSRGFCIYVRARACG